jgi:hypothetical protein
VSPGFLLLRIGAEAQCCENGNITSGSINLREFLECLTIH